eukprot:388893-Rhodomonas_salina.3
MSLGPRDHSSTCTVTVAPRQGSRGYISTRARRPLCCQWLDSEVKDGLNDTLRSPSPLSVGRQ